MSEIFFEKPAGGDEQAGADEPREQVTHPPGRYNAQPYKDRVADAGADHAKDNIGEQAVVGFHDFFRKPPCECADENGPEPADLMFFHFKILHAA